MNSRANRDSAGTDCARQGHAIDADGREGAARGVEVTDAVLIKARSRRLLDAALYLEVPVTPASRVLIVENTPDDTSTTPTLSARYGAR